MKMLIPFLALYSFTAFASELSVTLNCKTQLQTDGDVSTLTQNPVVLSTAGNNAHIFQMELGSDQDNSLIASLQEVSHTCADTACLEYSGTVYSLVIARIDDPTRNALQMTAPAKVEGTTSATAQITVKGNGKISSSFIAEDRLIMNADGLPASLSFQYRVIRKRFSNQKIDVSCSVSPGLSAPTSLI